MNDNDSNQKPARKPRQAPRLPLTREELLSLGEASARELQSTVFNVAVRDAIESWLDRIVSSSPEETALRESMYFHIRGLNGALQEFPGYINAARSMTEVESAEEFSAEAAWLRSMSSPMQ
ncbi:hypothetical protein UFOVP1008_46 [uncultured Caudovirales phage]|uniref:Uncharacterized protein n=2 Tax=uncultured Caudovirales phage TaxID=2100421 RepID=A0A6J5S3Q8_9CAUD|nr:hypothetical protein UFOVP1008_46 [uncultured Caudovirales phage]CAB4187575.1 hypothetical protein UFOVP1160_53 [uncultured Caudovirales phage]CAB4200459.1 hypothetical protein UFOVP1352_50 [uncultured Caudovirales phage]